MPVTYIAANRATTTLSAASGVSPTSFTVADGSAFPSPSGEQRVIVVVRAAADTTETGVFAVYTYSSRSGNTLSGVSFVSGTNQAWSGSDVISVRDVAEVLAATVQVDATQTVTGPKTFADGIAIHAAAERFTLNTSAPSDPPSTQMSAWARTISSGFPVPLWGVADALGSTSRDPFMHLLASPLYDRSQIAYAVTATGIVNIGPCSIANTSGTGALVQPAAGSIRSESFRQTWTIAAIGGANGVAAPTTTFRPLWRGNATGRGGFVTMIRFGLDTLTTNARVFVGFTDDSSSATIISAGDPSTRTANNTIAIIADKADTNITIGTCNATTFTKTALTTPRAKTAANQWYELMIACAPNASVMRVRLTELSNSNYTRTVLHDADLSTTLPLNTAYLRPIISANGADTADSTVMSFESTYFAWKAA